MITLREDDERLADACRAVEAACVRVTPDGTWEVKMLDDFSSFATATGLNTYARTPALYQKSTNTIFVNEAPFLAMAPATMVAALTHEVGHAHLAAIGKPDDCFAADLFACEQGQFDALAGERGGDAAYGRPYVAVLEQWQDPAAARQQFEVWRQRRLAGIT